MLDKTVLVDVLWEKLKQVLIVSNLIKFHTCVTAYLNLRTESQKHRKLCYFCEKNSYGLHQHSSVRPVLLCEEHGYVFADFFHEFDKITRRRSNNPFKQRYNPEIHVGAV